MPPRATLLAHASLAGASITMQPGGTAKAPGFIEENKDHAGRCVGSTIGGWAVSPA